MSPLTHGISHNPPLIPPHTSRPRHLSPPSRHANDTTSATRLSSRQGYDPVEDNTKGDPWRPDHAERAHRDFTRALASIEQLEGVDEFMSFGALKLSDKSEHSRLSYEARAVSPKTF